MDTPSTAGNKSRTESGDSASEESEDSSEDEVEIGIRQTDTDPTIKKRRVALIKKLLAEFDLEETLHRYRCLEPRDYRIGEAESSTSASANSRVKQRLERLMGTDIVKLNDKKYMQKLEKNIQHEYEAAMEKKEAERVNIEQMRMRRLAVQGLTSDDYDDMGNPKSRRGDKRKRKKSEYYDEMGGNMASLESQKPGHHPRYQDVKDEKRREDTDTRIAQAQIEQGPVHKADVKSDRSELGDSDRVSKKSLDSPREKYESPLVKQMKEEETVAGLYRLAQRIIL